jgi:hypothetical protein
LIMNLLFFFLFLFACLLTTHKICNNTGTGKTLKLQKIIDSTV